MGALTKTVGVIVGIPVGLAVVFGLAVGGGKLFKDRVVDPSVDANNDGQATVQEYGGKTVEILGDLTETAVEFVSGAADKAPETAKRVLDKVDEEFDLPDISGPDRKTPKLRTADDWRDGLSCREDQSDQECIEAAFDRLDQ